MSESPGTSRLQRLVGWLWLPVGIGLAGVAIAWPFFADAWMARHGVAPVAWALASLAGLALLAPSAGRALAPPWWGRLLFVVPCVAAALTEERRFLLVVPALVQAWVAWLFLRSRAEEISLFEQGARLMQPDAPGFIRPYCHRVSRLLGGLLATNAIVLLGLALFAPISVWKLWANGIFWGLLALLCVGEYVVRKWHFRYYTPSAIDRVWARFFPSEATPAGRRSQAFADAMEAQGIGPPTVLPWRRRSQRVVRPGDQSK